MSRIFWDTNVFIYLLEGEGEAALRARALRQRMQERSDQFFTSALVVAEILVKPAAAGDSEACRFYEQTISAAATVLGFGISHASLFATIRRNRAIRAPDAINLACAAGAGMDLFITADARLQGKQVEGIQFIVSLERAPL